MSIAFVQTWHFGAHIKYEALVFRKLPGHFRAPGIVRRISMPGSWTAPTSLSNAIQGHQPGLAPAPIQMWVTSRWSWRSQRAVVINRSDNWTGCFTAGLRVQRLRGFKPAAVAIIEHEKPRGIMHSSVAIFWPMANGALNRNHDYNNHH